jgi:hypothetical protein
MVVVVRALPQRFWLSSLASGTSLVEEVNSWSFSALGRQSILLLRVFSNYKASSL